jgi:hypothetical protein
LISIGIWRSAEYLSGCIDRGWMDDERLLREHLTNLLTEFMCFYLLCISYLSSVWFLVCTPTHFFENMQILLQCGCVDSDQNYNHLPPFLLLLACSKHVVKFAPRWQGGEHDGVYYALRPIGTDIIRKFTYGRGPWHERNNPPRHRRALPKVRSIHRRPQVAPTPLNRELFRLVVEREPDAARVTTLQRNSV